MTGSILRMAALVAALSSVAGGAAIAVECDLDAARAAETSAAAADEMQVAGVPSRLWPFYQKYKTLPHYRALACAGGGMGEPVGCSSVCGASDPRSAVNKAMANCKKLMQKNFPVSHPPCKLRFIGDIDVSGMNRSQLDQAIERYRMEVGRTDRSPGIRPGPETGIVGVSVRKFTFTSGVKDAAPVDELAAIRFSEGSFVIHVKWELDLAAVKQFIVRYEVFDAANKLVANQSVFHAPESRRWNTWQRIKFSKTNQPGKWKVSLYVSTGPGETRVGETQFAVTPE